MQHLGRRDSSVSSHAVLVVPGDLSTMLTLSEFVLCLKELLKKTMGVGDYGGL